MAENGFITTADGVRLECRRIVGGPGPTLLFLHEGLGCVALWRDFADRLCAASGLPGFIYSRQGYGASDPISLPRPVDFMHHEGLYVLPQVLDAAGLTDVILIGHSDGGSISLINAGGVGDRRVSAVVTLAAHVFNEDITVKSIEDAKVNFETTDLRDRLAKYHGENVDCAFWGWNGVWLNPEFKAWNIEEFLSPIKLPILVIQGTDDQYGTGAQVAAIAAGIGENAQTVMIDGCAHSPHLERPEKTLNTILPFVQRFCDRNR